MANNLRDPRLDARWRESLDRQRSSGLTVQAFCKREGISESSFYFWRRTIAGRDAKRRPVSRSLPGPADSRRGARRVTEPSFVPVILHHDAHHPSGPFITIELRGGRVLRLPESILPSRLAELIHALEVEPRS